jgi:hypothetical protein
VQLPPPDKSGATSSADQVGRRALDMPGHRFHVLGCCTCEVFSLCLAQLLSCCSNPGSVQRAAGGMRLQVRVAISSCHNPCCCCCCWHRWAKLQSLLQLSSTDLLALLQQEPRLLMPSSQTLSQNHAAACAALDISPATLNSWVLAAPMLLLVPAAQLQKRVATLGRILAEQAELIGVPSAAGSSETADSSSSNGWVCRASDPATLRAYIAKDPRVLLLQPNEVWARLAVLQQELCCSRQLLLWLVLQHPSYLAVEPGSVSSWAADVRHLCQMSSAQALRLVLCPQVRCG